MHRFSFREMLPILTKTQGYLQKFEAMVLVWQTSYSFKLLYTESCEHHKTLISWYKFSMWHFTINMKAIYLYVSDRSCQFLSKHPDIFTSLKLRSLSDKLHTAFFNLLYSESRAPPQGSHFMVQHFSMWHSLYHALWITYGNGYSQQL